MAKNEKNDEKIDLSTLRHSTSHVMAAAVLSLFPTTKPTIGPSVEEGFYYDFEAEPFHPEDLARIEKKMHDIVSQDLKFEKQMVSKAEALKIFKDNKFKVEMINDLEEGTISIYKLGNFVDLCRGPHVPSTKYIKAFKLTKIAGAYWRADAKNEQLQRLYGTAFLTEKELKDYLTLLLEAEKRDHKKLGRQLDLFSIHEEGPGFPFFHHKGLIIINILKDFMRKTLFRNGYIEVSTPLILNRRLWEQSGHWDHYREAMYFTKIDNQDFSVKPMNCPGGILLFKEGLHSYKDMPIRMAEMGIVHRHELSGVLNGLFRVRCFTQDDAHVYCREDQIKEEIVKLIKLTDYIYKTFGFTYAVELSTMPDAAKIGENKQRFENAEKILQEVLKEAKFEFKINPGDGAFYGPKIDFHLRDAIGRTWQCGTIQLDFSMPELFDLVYIAEDGKKHRVTMLHRTLYGSLERFFGILIEHYAGKFPLWLAPVQVRIMTVADRFTNYANELAEQMRDAGLRVDIDARTESVGKKVREAQVDKIPLAITIGEKEEQAKTLAVRTLDGKVAFGLKMEDFLKKVQKSIDGKKAVPEI